MKLPKNLEPLELSRREFVVLCVLFSILVVGMVIKFVMDSHLGSGEITVLRQNPEELTLRLDINTVEWHQLLPLPQIGEKRAKAIVEYREKHGPFTSMDELLNIKGMTPKVIEAIRGSIKISDKEIKVDGKDAEKDGWLTSN